MEEEDNNEDAELVSQYASFKYTLFPQGPIGIQDKMESKIQKKYTLRHFLSLLCHIPMVSCSQKGRNIFLGIKPTSTTF